MASVWLYTHIWYDCHVCIVDDGQGRFHVWVIASAGTVIDTPKGDFGHSQQYRPA
jgi:hypothetical protein